MKKILFVIFASLMLFGCAKNGELVYPDKSNDDFNVKLLFEIDGVKVYRFYDAGYYRYFSTGVGTYIPTRIAQSRGKRGSSSWEDGVFTFNE